MAKKKAFTHWFQAAGIVHISKCGNRGGTMTTLRRLVTCSECIAKAEANRAAAVEGHGRVHAPFCRCWSCVCRINREARRAARTGVF